MSAHSQSRTGPCGESLNIEIVDTDFGLYCTKVIGITVTISIKREADEVAAKMLLRCSIISHPIQPKKYHTRQVCTRNSKKYKRKRDKIVLRFHHRQRGYLDCAFENRTTAPNNIFMCFVPSRKPTDNHRARALLFIDLFATTTATKEQTTDSFFLHDHQGVHQRVLKGFVILLRCDRVGQASGCLADPFSALKLRKD